MAEKKEIKKLQSFSIIYTRGGRNTKYRFYNLPAISEEKAKEMFNSLLKLEIETHLPNGTEEEREKEYKKFDIITVNKIRLEHEEESKSEKQNKS